MKQNYNTIYAYFNYTELCKTFKSTRRAEKLPAIATKNNGSIGKEMNNDNNRAIVIINDQPNAAIKIS